MKVYPTISGALCANSHPGSYSGQDAYNDMLPVIEVDQDEMVLHGQRTDAQCFHEGDCEYLGRNARRTDRDRLQGLRELVGGGIASPLDASYYKGTGNRNGEEREYLARQDEETNQTGRKYVLRRLTPTECARLQGFPDWWVDGADGSDSAIYKMWGNGIALPCAVDVLGRIARAVQRGW